MIGSIRLNGAILGAWTGSGGSGGAIPFTREASTCPGGFNFSERGHHGKTDDPGDRVVDRRPDRIPAFLLPCPSPSGRDGGKGQRGGRSRAGGKGRAGPRACCRRRRPRGEDRRHGPNDHGEDPPVLRVPRHRRGRDLLLPAERVQGRSRVRREAAGHPRREEAAPADAVALPRRGPPSPALPSGLLLRRTGRGRGQGGRDPKRPAHVGIDHRRPGVAGVRVPRRQVRVRSPHPGDQRVEGTGSGAARARARAGLRGGARRRLLLLRRDRCGLRQGRPEPVRPERHLQGEGRKGSGAVVLGGREIFHLDRPPGAGVDGYARVAGRRNRCPRGGGRHGGDLAAGRHGARRSPRLRGAEADRAPRGNGEGSSGPDRLRMVRRRRETARLPDEGEQQGDGELRHRHHPAHHPDKDPLLPPHPEVDGLHAEDAGAGADPQDAEGEV